MKYENYIKLEFPSKSCNEALARSVAGVFASQMDPTMEELGDIKTAVSEAVTNVVVHAYDEKDTGVLQIECSIPDDKKSIEIVVRDFGKGIKDVKEAVEPFFTTAQDDERSGMGFTIIDTFMDEMDVASVIGDGTVVKMKKVMKGC